MAENYFIVTENGTFINREKNLAVIDFNHQDIITFFDVNLNTELGKISGIDSFIYNNEDLLEAFTMIDILVINIINKSFFNHSYFKNIISKLSSISLKDKKIQNQIRLFFKPFSNNIISLSHHKAQLVYLQNEVRDNISYTRDNYIVLNKNQIKKDYENTFLHDIFENVLTNYNSFLNTSYYSSYEKEMTPDDKINYPKYLLEKPEKNISKHIFYKEKERVEFFNSILNVIYNKKQYSLSLLDNDLSDFSTSLWHTNSLMSFNILFDFLKKFNPLQNNKPLKKFVSKNSIIEFLKEQPVITITSLFFIDVMYNYEEYQNLSKKENQQLLGKIKLEGFSGSGSTINRFADKEKERKFKNSIFDIVDIVSSLTTFNLSSIYITSDKGINLLFNWFDIDFKNINIKPKISDSLFNYISADKLFEYQMKKKKFIPISINHNLRNSLSSIEDNRQILNILLDSYFFTNFSDINYFSLFYNSGYCKFFEELPYDKIGYSLLDLIRLHDKGLICSSIQNPNQLIIDVFLRNLLNIYIGYINKSLAEKLVIYQNDYFSF